MESRFRRLFAPRRLSSTSSVDQTPSLDDLDAHSVPYESTSTKEKRPVFIYQPLRKGTVAAQRAKDDLEGLAIRAFSYDSALAGKAPIIGGRPMKGNGPVKLQTNRRLSSGELLVTHQEWERTLEDIREGEYIIGRKDKRMSRASQARSPTPTTNALSPRVLPSAGSSPQLRPDRTISANSGMVVIPTVPTIANNLTPPSPITSLLTAGMQESRSSIASGQPSASSDNLVLEPRLTSRSSLLSRHEEQNSTIQALWKAEYGRLVAIYGKDGVDRNIAELNRDCRRSSSPEKNQQTLYAMSALGMTLEPLPNPSFDSDADLPLKRSSHVSSITTKDISSTDENSDYASTKRSSVTSSDAQTVRTSGFEPELPTTREDVRRVVEDMRSTYLRAIEAKGGEKLRGKKPKKRRERASYSHGSVPSKSAMKQTRPSRQSWHASNAPETVSPSTTEVKPTRKPSETLKTPHSKASIKSKSNGDSKPGLQRADSMTLGNLMGSPKKTSIRTPPRISAAVFSPQTPKAVLASPADLTIHDQVEDYTSPEALGPNIAPEIDDFDIFYQDLYGPPPTASSMPSIPRGKRSSMPNSQPSIRVGAPPPPNIEWSPRRRTLNQV